MNDMLCRGNPAFVNFAQVYVNYQLFCLSDFFIGRCDDACVYVLKLVNENIEIALSH